MADHQQRYSGTLELTWTNKHKRLLAEEDGSYQWVPPSDYRVAEVRLLEDAGTVGKTRSQRDRAKDNLLIRGDALNALTSLGELPEFTQELVGKVRLAYLDPPFNTKQSFLHYDDNLEHSVWLTMMRDRLIQIQRLLDPTRGSIWVHCDDSEQATLRVVMDEVFTSSNWITTIVWQKRTSRENRAAFSSSHDYIHVYSPAGPTGWRDVRNRLARGGKALINPDSDPRGPWESIPFTAQGFRENQMYTITTPTGVEHSPPKGRCWGATENTYHELLAEKLIYFPKNGSGRPRVKQFPETAKGLVPMTWWQASEVGDNEESKKEILELFPTVEPFVTPKPERFLRQVIAIATDIGDIVLDCFLGSGTTAAVAHKMGRRWIGIERSVETFDTYLIPRLTKVVEGKDPGGVTEQVDWPGGGGFRVLDVAPSMFDEEDGTVYLASWATSSRLAEACAAQMHYEFEPELPFAGRRGRTRLAVIDGLVNVDVVQLLVANLPDEDRVVICGTAVDPAARTRLREIRSGCSVRKIPASILQDYRQSRWEPLPTASPADPNATVPVADEVPKTPTEA